jgi:hypothetical protein
MVDVPLFEVRFKIVGHDYFSLYKIQLYETGVCVHTAVPLGSEIFTHGLDLYPTEFSDLNSGDFTHRLRPSKKLGSNLPNPTTYAHSCAGAAGYVQLC